MAFFHATDQKIPIFSLLLLVKTRLEIRFNNVLDRKETFFKYKNKIFQSPKISVFQRG